MDSTPSPDEPADLTSALAAAHEAAYRAFARYRIKGRLEACPCGCITEADHARIRSGPLRELTEDDLETYASKAMTTWGDSSDFRHFLPRLLELVTGSPADEICNEIALSKLSYADWWDWPQFERDTVERVLWLRWRLGLTLSPSEFDADTWLCCVAIVGVDSKPYIDAWRTATTEAAFTHLAAFLGFNSQLMTQGTLSNSFYFDGGARVAEPMREWLAGVLADDAFQERLAAGDERRWS